MFIIVPDNAMAPRFPAGARVQIDTGKAVRLGDYGFFEIADKFTVLRRLIERDGEPILWAADPQCAQLRVDGSVRPLGRATFAWVGL